MRSLRIHRVSDSKTPPPPGARPLNLVSLGAILGCTYGYLEAIEVLVAGRIPGILAWGTGNAAHIAWFAPLFYAVVGLVASVPFVAFSALTRRASETAMVFTFAAFGAWLAASLAGGVIAQSALIILSLGLATVVLKLYRAYGHILHRHRARFGSILAGGIPLAAIAVLATNAIRERAAYWQSAPANAGAPNVLFLVLDTQRAENMSTYGYARPTSPHIDSLAADALLFEQAFSPSSWTLPSHASYFTGRLPQEHRAGVIRRPYLDGRYPTVAEAFQAAGYATGAFVANGYWCGRQTGLNRGFVRYEDFYGSPGDALARTALGRIIAYDWLPKLGYVDIPGRKRVDRINRDFLDWMDGLDGRPFMAFLNYFDVHGPRLPPAPYEGRFAGKPVQRGKTIDIGALTGNMPVYARAAIQDMIDRYDESLLSLDAGIGRLVDTLRAKGVLDHTILILTSDHGESYGEHGMMAHGHSMFRDQIHVPLIMRFPGRLSAGARVTQPVGAERVAATMLELAGLSREGFAGEPLPLSDSTAAVPAIGGAGRRSLSRANWPTARGWVSSVVAGSWHFILNEDGSTHAYALSDEQEEQDLAATPGVADSVRAWVKRYQGLWSGDNPGVRR